MDSENENKELEIVMGDDIELNISDVGDIMNNLRPHTSERKTNIIIPVAKKKTEDTDSESTEDEEDVENDDEIENNNENDEK